MNLTDIKNQNGKWAEKCEVFVDEVGEPLEQQGGGFLQYINVTFAPGQKATMNFYYNGSLFEIDVLEIGKQWYKIRWNGTYLRCCPTDPPENEPVTKGVDWDKIALGKCRHNILIAFIGAGVNLHNLAEKDCEWHSVINKLAYFSMHGELEK